MTDLEFELEMNNKIDYEIRAKSISLILIMPGLRKGLARSMECTESETVRGALTTGNIIWVCVERMFFGTCPRLVSKEHESNRLSIVMAY